MFHQENAPVPRLLNSHTSICALISKLFIDKDEKRYYYCIIHLICCFEMKVKVRKLKKISKTIKKRFKCAIRHQWAVRPECCTDNQLFNCFHSLKAGPVSWHEFICSFFLSNKLKGCLCPQTHLYSLNLDFWLLMIFDRNLLSLPELQLLFAFFLNVMTSVMSVDYVSSRPSFPQLLKTRLSSISCIMHQLMSGGVNTRGHHGDPLSHRHGTLKISGKWCRPLNAIYNHVLCNDARVVVCFVRAPWPPVHPQWWKKRSNR